MCAIVVEAYIEVARRASGITASCRRRAFFHRSRASGWCCHDKSGSILHALLRYALRHRVLHLEDHYLRTNAANAGRLESSRPLVVHHRPLPAV
jgi:hypothetical protein